MKTKTANTTFAITYIDKNHMQHTGLYGEGWQELRQLQDAVADLRKRFPNRQYSIVEFQG
jgi:hypothetical protein